MSKTKRSSALRPRPQAWIYIDKLGRALEQATQTPGGALVPLKSHDVIVTADSLRQLGRALREIAHGSDPRAAFPVGSREEQRRSAQQFQFTRSLIFWRARALGRSVDEAVAEARAHFGELVPAPGRASILRYARMNRERCLGMITDSVRILPDGTREPGPTSKQVDELRDKLKRRGEGDWLD